MKKASEYRQHAEECRSLARKLEAGEHRELLVTMASTWDTLADERERDLKLRSSSGDVPSAD
jgi:hypothetical protein